MSSCRYRTVGDRQRRVGVTYATRRGDRVQVFDKMGTFQKDILVPYEKRSQNGPRLGHVPPRVGNS